MNTDQIVILADGFVLGLDACLLIVLGGRIWDDHQDRRAVRRAIAKADARQGRLDATLAKVDATLAKATGGQE